MSEHKKTNITFTKKDIYGSAKPGYIYKTENDEARVCLYVEQRTQTSRPGELLGRLVELLAAKGIFDVNDVLTLVNSDEMEDDEAGHKITIE